MILTTELKKELLRRAFFESRISANPMRDGFAICLANRERTMKMNNFIFTKQKRKLILIRVNVRLECKLLK